ncbi:MAG: TetR/AcrR family transcriptional regulator [Spirochaetaceae bacterium]|jgi:AcrR family transcriptional regulator|nr:TetR/AcrR family transcriptional regulator [Spirochaetaceae bacterium]
MNREDSKAEGTGERIARIAIGLFREKGYDNVTIDEICRAAGVVKGTFYYHFKAKEEVVLNFYKRLAQRFDDKTARILVSSDNSWEKVWAISASYFEQTSLAGPEVEGQIIINGIKNRTNPFTMPEFHSRLRAIGIALIKKGQSLGHFRNMAPPEALQNNMIHISIGLVFDWSVAGGSFDIKQAMKEATIALLDVREDLLGEGEAS